VTTTSNSVPTVPLEDQAFHVEQRGIDFVPEAERWATARNIGAMWAGSALNVEYFIYGALLMGFGFSFPVALSLIVIGNLSFFLLGVASLQGPTAGTTAFTITRASFGTKGSRIMAFFNWITQLGFETEGLILIVGAAIVLSEFMGFQVGKPAKVIFIVLAAGLQAVMPYFGHATMIKVLRALIIPFGVIFLAFAYFDLRHGTVHTAPNGQTWQLYTAGLAFVIALSGLGWTECGNDYTRYLPVDTPRRSIIGWTFVATAIPEITIMILGALTFSFLSDSKIWNSANPFEALNHQHAIPHWFVAVFLIFAILQLFGINSLDLYSSGVSLQAMGVRLKRYQAVVLDSCIAGVLTIWAVFASTFSLYMKEFVGVIIVWIAPWFAIFITDWILRRYRYSPSELQRRDAQGLYFGHDGYNWNALIAFGVGMVGATLGFSKAPPPVNFPFHFMTPISNHFNSACAGPIQHGVCHAGWFGGADFSVFIGIFVAALTYLVLEKLNQYVHHQMDGAPLTAPIDTPRVVGAAMMTVSGGLIMIYVAFSTMGLSNDLTIRHPLIPIVTALLGVGLVALGAMTLASRSDRYRDRTLAFGVLIVLWALFVYGFASQPGTVFGASIFEWIGYAPLSHATNYFGVRAIGGSWALLTAGLLVIGARGFFPLGAQNPVKMAESVTL
jgi:NCS1 family nucleobase:cation symporter-1